jgi:hypothetical protein
MERQGIYAGEGEEVGRYSSVSFANQYGSERPHLSETSSDSCWGNFLSDQRDGASRAVGRVCKQNANLVGGRTDMSFSVL